MDEQRECSQCEWDGAWPCLSCWDRVWASYYRSTENCVKHLARQLQPVPLDGYSPLTAGRVWVELMDTPLTPEP